MFRIVLPDRELIFGHGQDLYDQFCPIDLPLPNITLDLAADYPHRYAGQINYTEGIRPPPFQQALERQQQPPTVLRHESAVRPSRSELHRESSSRRGSEGTGGPSNERHSATKSVSKSASSSSSSVPSSSGGSKAARGTSDPKARVAHVPSPLTTKGRMNTAGGKREPSNDSQHPPPGEEKRLRIEARFKDSEEPENGPPVKFRGRSFNRIFVAPSTDDAVLLSTLELPLDNSASRMSVIPVPRLTGHVGQILQDTLQEIAAKVTTEAGRFHALRECIKTKDN